MGRYIDNLGVTRYEIIVGKHEDYEARGALSAGPHLHHAVTQPNGTVVEDIFTSEINAINYAHIHFNKRGKGSGVGLSNRCPNFHNPNLKWVLALNGHALDYTQDHVPTASDEEFANKDVDPRTLTALASACFYGTDYYSDGIVVHDVSCNSDDDPKHPVAAEPLPPSYTKPDQEIAPIPGAQRYDMGGQLGKFDVSAFSHGDGFIVRHVNSGEIIEVSIFNDKSNIEELNPSIDVDSEAVDAETVILVVLTIPPMPKAIDETSLPITSPENSKHGLVSSLSSWKPYGVSWKSLFRGDDTPEQSLDNDKEEVPDDEPPQRHVVVADMEGHSYVCRVILTRKNEESYSANNMDGLEEDERLAEYPCSPAMFGKSNMPSLNESGGVIIKADLQEPPFNDELGCQVPPIDGGDGDLRSLCQYVEELPNDQKEVVQMVRRGLCNFTFKAVNQRIRHNAEAVIVINSEPDELFVMAGDNMGGVKSHECTDEQVPISVLVSKNDGENMIGIKRFEDIKGNKISATVELSEQNSESSQHFPYVKTAKDTLQIFASNGWGAHAVKQASTTETEKKDFTSGWQLFIMQHNQKM